MANRMPGTQVAELTGYTPVHVSRIRARCCAERTAAVHERARSGRPRTITARKIAQVVALTLAPPPRGLSRWSGREMARRARLAPSVVHHIIRDHLSAPATPDVEAWLEAHPHVPCHWTPTGASWTTLLEAWFSILTRKSIRRGSFHNVRQLVHHIKAYLRRWHETPTPFVWTKSAADVIATAVRPNREINTTKRSRH